MKELLIVLFLGGSLLRPENPYVELRENSSDTLIGVFDGRTPCHELAKQLDEKAGPACIKIKWRLSLYKNRVNANSGTYELQGFVYKKESPRIGRWHILKGTKADPQAVVYRLDDPVGESLFLQKGDENILFFLSPQKELLVGNRDFSYTLNRVK